LLTSPCARGSGAAIGWTVIHNQAAGHRVGSSCHVRVATGAGHDRALDQDLLRARDRVRGRAGRRRRRALARPSGCARGRRSSHVRRGGQTDLAQHALVATSGARACTPGTAGRGAPLRVTMGVEAVALLVFRSCVIHERKGLNDVYAVPRTVLIVIIRPNTTHLKPPEALVVGSASGPRFSILVSDHPQRPSRGSACHAPRSTGPRRRGLAAGVCRQRPAASQSPTVSETSSSRSESRRTWRAPEAAMGRRTAIVVL